MWKKKNDGYVDLSERMRARQEKIADFRQDIISKPEQELKQSSEQKKDSTNGGFFSFFGGNNSVESPGQVEPVNEVLGVEQKKKLAKRLIDMTNRMEDLENQIYQLKNKVEVLEKKERIGY